MKQISLKMKNDSHLEVECFDYVNWFNKYRVHGTLGYLTPIQYRQQALKKVV